MNVEAQLKELGLELPEVPKPVPEYVPAKKSIEEGSLNVPATLEYVLEVSKKQCQRPSSRQSPDSMVLDGSSYLRTRWLLFG